MANFTNSTNWTGSITLTQQSGTNLTIPVGNKFVDRNVEITLAVREGQATLSATGSATINSLNFAYNNNNFNITGSKAISGTASANIDTSGWISSIANGSTTGTASVQATVNQIALGAKITGTAKVTPVISKHNNNNASIGTVTTERPSDGHYVAVSSAALASTITATPKVTTAGYGTIDHYSSTNATLSVGANASNVTYIPINPGSISLSAPGSATISQLTYTYNTSNGQFDVTGSGSISGTTTATVTEGYIDANTTGSISGTASLSGVTVPKIGIKATLSGAISARKPTISKQAVPSGIIDAASGAATITPPSSGVYVAVQSAANTDTITATPTVTAAGYGTKTSGQYTPTNDSKTVGAAASDMTYIPITTGTAAANTASADVSTFTTDGSNAGVNIHNIVGTKATTEPTSGYYLAFTASGSGSSKITKAGWMNTGTLTAASTTATKYFPITAAKISIGGGGLTKGAGSSSLTSFGYYNGSSYDSSDKITLSTTEADGYYKLVASGSGTVNRAAITGSVTQAGYAPTSGADITGTSAATSLASNNKDTNYFIKKATFSTITRDFSPSTSAQSITINAGYLPSDTTINFNAMTTVTPTTSYANSNMSTYFNAGSASDYSVSITPRYSNSAGYVSAHTNTNNGGVGYWKIKTTSVAQGTTTVSGTTATRGTATWGTGWMTSSSLAAASFANSATSGVTYVDISDTTASPVLTSQGYLYINKGYTDNLRISLAKLIPNGANVNASNQMLNGVTAYDNDGVLWTGNIPTKSSSDLTVSDETVTVPAGYYASNASKSIPLGTIKSGTCTPTIGDPSYDSTNSNFTISVSGTISAPTVPTAGYVSSSKGTKQTNTLSGTKTLAVVALGTVKDSGNLTMAPSIVRTAKPSSDTWIDAASGAAVSSKPDSGVYVQVDAAANTNTLKIKGKVTTAGYGTTSNYTTSTDNYTVGAAKAAPKWVPIKTSTTSTTNGTVTTTAGTANTSVTGMVTTSTNTGYSVSATATGGNASVTASTVTASVGYITSALSASTSASSKTGASASQTKYIQKGVLAATVSSTSEGSASMAANGFTASSAETIYYVTLSTSAGSVKAKASVGTEGYVKNETAETSATTVNVSGNGTKLYIPAGDYSAAASQVTAGTITPSVAINNASTYGFTTTKPSGTNGTNYLTLDPGASVTTKWKARATATITTAGYLATGSKTNDYEGTPTIAAGTNYYVPIVTPTFAGGAVSGSTTTAITVTNMATTTTPTSYYIDAEATGTANRAAVTYSNSAGAIAAHSGTTASAAPSAAVDVGSSATRVYIPAAGLTFAGGALNSKGATATFINSNNKVISTASSDTYNNGLSVLAKGSAGRAAVTYTSTAGYLPANTTAQNASPAVSSSTWNGTTYYLTGIKLAAPSSGIAKFDITVPNGSTSEFITFQFQVDTEGNVTVMGPD